MFIAVSETVKAEKESLKSEGVVYGRGTITDSSTEDELFEIFKNRNPTSAITCQAEPMMSDTASQAQPIMVNAACQARSSLLDIACQTIRRIICHQGTQTPIPILCCVHQCNQSMTSSGVEPGTIPQPCPRSTSDTAPSPSRSDAQSARTATQHSPKTRQYHDVDYEERTDLGNSRQI